MKRFGLFGLVLVVSILGACNDNAGGSNFGIPDGQNGEVRITVGTSPSCVGGANDGEDCSPFADCRDAFCVQICIGGTDITDFRTPCTSDADCEDTCAVACDRGIDAKLLCSQDTNCPDGTCTTALIHEFEGFFTYTGDPFVTIFPGTEGSGSIDTDGDGDGFTPAFILDNAPLGAEGEISIDFLDNVPDCVTVDWGPQRVEVLPETCGDPVEATFSFPN